MTPWTLAHQAPVFMGFSRQEYWRGQSFPSPGDLPNPGIETGSPTMQADSILSELPGKPVLINLLKIICSKSGLIFEAKNENISKIYKNRIKILK